MGVRESQRLGGSLDLLGLGQRRRERPLRAQSGVGFEQSDVDGGASYAAQYAIGETLVHGLEVYRAAETIEETGGEFSVDYPGVGRRLHLAFALSEGECEELLGVVVGGEVLSGPAFAREAEVAAVDGGGVTYTAETGRGGLVRVTSYLEGNAEQGATLREASARMDVAPDAGALAWSADHQGEGISWCHVELEQPAGLDHLVWDGVPELGFLLKGKHLRAPSSGDPSTWLASYTDSASAVRYWWLFERRSAPAERMDLDTVRSADGRTGQRIELRVDETVRYAWQATADAPEPPARNAGQTIPAAPAGNEFLPMGSSWSKTAVAPTDALPLVWRAESIKDGNGVWSDWGSVRLYQEIGLAPHVDARPPGDPEPVLPAAPADGSAYVVEFDRYTEGLPAGLNPGHGEDPVRLAFLADATSSRYGVAGVISAADDVARVEEELDFAWAGSVVEQGGMLCFRPGADGAPVATLDTSVHDPVSVEAPPPVSERINAASLSLAASRIHGGGYNLPQIEDAESVAADGSSARHDLGEAALLSSPTAAKRLVSTMLRASQTSRISRYRFEVGDRGSWLSVRPGQQVTLTDLSLRSAGMSMLVVGARVVPDTATASAVLELDLVEQEPATFRDVIELPVSRSDRSRSDDPTVVVSRPRELTIEERLVAAGDVTTSYLLVTWRAHSYASTELQWRSTSGDTSTNWSDGQGLVSLGARAVLSPVTLGETYEVRARHVSQDGMVSRWEHALPALVEGDTTSISAPSGLVATAMPAGVRLEWSHPSEKGYLHTEIHSDIALTDATLVGTVRGTYFEEYFETLADPAAAREYWVRHLNRRCKASAVVRATVTPLAVVEPGRGDP